MGRLDGDFMQYEWADDAVHRHHAKLLQVFCTYIDDKPSDIININIAIELVYTWNCIDLFIDMND